MGLFVTTYTLVGWLRENLHIFKIPIPDYG